MPGKFQFVQRSTPHGPRVFPVTLLEFQKLVKEGKVQPMGKIYREVVPEDLDSVVDEEPDLPPDNGDTSVYETRTMVSETERPGTSRRRRRKTPVSE